MNKKSDKKSIVQRVESLEKTKRWLTFCGGLMSLFGLSLGSMLYSGYSSLKVRENELRLDYSNLRTEYVAATNDLAEVRMNSQTASESAFAKCAELTRLCSNIVEKAKTANIQVEAIESDCQLAQDMLRGLEAYIAKNVKVVPQKFIIDVTGVMAKCTFVEGDSAPYSRAVSGKLANALVVVPPGTVCVVRPTGKMCKILIQSRIRDRVIVEGAGKMSRVSYFN